MGAIILDPPKRKAREIVVAPRLPATPTVHTGNPFTTVGDVVADCDLEGCGYHIWGPRHQVGHLMREHHRLYHSDKIGVVLLNQPRQ